MPSLPELLQQGTGHTWLFVPTAILLGALHGLEPGHSKTLMAAFIIAIRGTVRQAVLLGLCAALSHTAIVWAVALIGQHFGQAWMGEAAEARLQLIAGALILAIGGWTAWQIRRDHHHHDHAHHHHASELRRIATRAGTLTLAIVEDGVPPRWRIQAADGPLLDAQALRLSTIRPDGARQDFALVEHDGYLESRDTIPEPHAFTARLALGAETHDLAFAEHDHDHPGALDLGEADDAHARAHAADIQRRFAGRTVTTGQIVLFGLTGGLIPCPAAITVLLLCMQLKQLSLGFALVLCFGIGLALTLVAAGIVAALGLRHAAGCWPGLSTLAARAPYASAGLIVLVGLYTGYVGWQGLHGVRRTAAAITQ
ncbi:nickel/cobalt efflux transporter [Methylobacterium sp. GC_Met_2]|uniref:nickel/cobalt efflux transporter n=1 Tax=Methylobacterium sp. GC_Met_2 TaxID=2937376 RepID=UPI00226B9112